MENLVDQLNALNHSSQPLSTLADREIEGLSSDEATKAVDEASVLQNRFAVVKHRGNRRRGRVWKNLKTAKDIKNEAVRLQISPKDIKQAILSAQVSETLFTDFLHTKLDGKKEITNSGVKRVGVEVKKTRQSVAVRILSKLSPWLKNTYLSDILDSDHSGTSEERQEVKKLLGELSILFAECARKI